MLDRLTVARGIASGVELFERDGRPFAVVTMESDGAMVVLDLDRPVVERSVRPFETVQRMGVPVGEGSVSPRINDGEQDQIQSWSWIGRTASSYLELMLVEAARGVPMEDHEMAAAPPSELDPVVLEGRRMFFSTDDARMAAAGSGVSCSACHQDGRTDGFTWQVSDFDRQTPSLAGPVYLTEPVTWKGDVDTVEREVHLTTTQRMGGDGVSFGEAETVAAYVNWSRGVIVPKGDPAQVARGKALFERPDVACVSCHAGEQGTYGATVPLYDLPAVNVPGLKGIRATAPYFHDGSAATLRDVLVRSRDGSMGNTGALSASEMDDLEAYLRQF
jgi:mono/diheme cytochrome c family protein